MKSFTANLLFVLMILASPLSSASETAALTGGLGVLEPWVGSWRFDGAWTTGATLWAQAEYRPRLGGTVLDGVVFVRDGDGPLYQRYRTVFVWDEVQAVVRAHAFSHDGSYTVTVMRVEDGAVSSSWRAGRTLIEERTELSSGSEMRWQVWSTPAEGERVQMMDGLWLRAEPEKLELEAPQQLAPQVAPLEKLLGGWELSDAWSDGTAVWARNEYRVGLAGRFVFARSFSLDGEGGDGEREISVFTGQPEGEGGQVVRFNREGEVSKARWAATRHPWQLDIHELSGVVGAEQQSLQADGDQSLRWRVVRRVAPGAAWHELIDATWWRQGQRLSGQRESIDPARFVASGVGLRSFVREQRVKAPVAEVYEAWTTPEGWSRLWPSPAAFRVELAIGGPYEWMFNGWLGSNGCQVLSYIPERMISFSWNAPPSLPDTRLARTWVVVETEALDESTTQVRLTHLGFGEGEAWDQTKAYFEKAWAHVLALMAERLGPKP